MLKQPLRRKTPLKSTHAKGIAMRKHILSSVFFLILSFTLCAIYAKTSNPKGCISEGFSFDHQVLVLNPSLKSNIFLIYNNSQQPTLITLEQGQHYPFPNHLKSILFQKKWSSLATMDTHTLRFHCYASGNDAPNAKPLGCQSILHVCQYKNTRFGENNKGTYWVVSNQTLNQTVKQTIKKGIILR